MVAAVRRWWRQLWCLHAEMTLTGIMRGSVTYQRWAMYHCPTCDKDWKSTRLPSSINRENPWH